MTSHPDQALVNKLLDGDKRAFVTFFNRYCPRLFRYARVRLCNSEELAEEVVQVALSKAVQKLSSYRAEAALYSWLSTFCRHEINKVLQREAKHGKRISLEYGESGTQEIMDAAFTLCDSLTLDPSEVHSAQQVVALVQVAKASISPRYSEALEQKYLCGYSIREMALAAGESEKATESMLTRARVSFKNAFIKLARRHKINLPEMD